MSLAAVVAGSWERNRLFSVLFELTYRCNLDCFFCYNDLGLKGTPLSRAEWLRTLEELAAMNVFEVTLSGGEPLAHPDFLALGRRARELGFVVRIKSNGHAFRGEMARRIREEIDPFMVETSLHGASAATHDRQTRVPGSFDRLLENLAGMKALGFRVKANVPLTSWNEHETEAILDLGERLGVFIQVDPEISVRDDGDRTPLDVSPSREGIERLFRLQLERSARTGAPGGPADRPAVDADLPAPSSEKHCGAGSNSLAVDPFGNVYPCVQWRVPAGNLHERSIRAIWEGSETLSGIRETTKAVKTVVGAEPGGRLMAFCPGASHAQTGNPLAILPSQRLRAASLTAAFAEPSLPSHPGR